MFITNVHTGYKAVCMRLATGIPGKELEEVGGSAAAAAAAAALETERLREIRSELQLL
jgi:hypothetical protein